MIDRDEARKIAADWLATQPTPGLRVLDDSTIETELGWVFFYASEHAIAGNAPVIVDRRDGALSPTGTAHPIEHYIERYRRQRPA
jgi:hypothetical protein